MGGIIVLKEKVINSLIISVVFAFNLCIFGPLEFFYSNIFEFWFSINQLLPIIIITFVVTSIIIFFLTHFTKNKLNSAIIRIIFILTVCLYIQGNYLNIGYNVLDGNDINWSSMIFKGIINTIIWVCIIIIPFAVKKMKEKAFFYKCSNIISAFIFLIEVITLITIIIMGTSSGSEKKTEFYLDATNIYNISNDENIIVFVSDAFEATYMNEILEKCPEYKEKLVDFTYFDNTTGASIRTSFSMPTMLTGNSFVLGKNMEQNIEYCFENTEVYDILKENNYDAELYTDTNLISAKEDKITNKIEKELIMKNESKYKIAELLYKCVLYKYLPHFLKSNFVVNTADFNNVNLEDANQYIFDDVKFNKELLEKGIKINSGNKKYKLYHLNGTHMPYDITEDISYDKSLEYLKVEKTVRRDNQIKASLNILLNYIEKLKEVNAYNNSTIIFLADHGEENKYYINLMIKPKNVSGDFKVSHAPISIAEDFIPTILNIVTDSKKNGRDIFDYSESKVRTRKIYEYRFAHGDHIFNLSSKVIVATDSNAADIEKYYVLNTESNKGN